MIDITEVKIQCAQCGREIDYLAARREYSDNSFVFTAACQRRVRVEDRLVTNQRFVFDRLGGFGWQAGAGERGGAVGVVLLRTIHPSRTVITMHA